MKKDFDIVIIGFGKGGKTLALKAAQKGQKVALIEKSKNMYGGTCINLACIPTKKLLEESKYAKFHQNKDEFFKTSMQKKDNLIKTLRDKNYEMLSSNQNITIFDGVASFISSSEIKITSKDGEKIISGEKIVINSGSVAKEFPLEVKNSNLLSSNELQNINYLPKHLVIFGSSFIALEFATIFSNFRSKVTIIARNENFLPNEDDDIKSAIFDDLSKAGIEIILGAKVEKLENNTLTYTKNNQENIINADTFLNAYGRVANTNGLNLENANIKCNEKGDIIVDEFLQTSTKNIYALGDAKGGELFTYISLDDFRILHNQFFEDKSRSLKNRPAYAQTLFLNTPYSHIGLNEKMAKEQNIDIKIAKLPSLAIPNARIKDETQGFLKALVCKDSGKILGASFYCYLSHELINEIALAINCNASYTLFKNQIFTHPSMSEALNDLFSQI